MGFASSQMASWAHGQRNGSRYQMQDEAIQFCRNQIPPGPRALEKPALGGQLPVSCQSPLSRLEKLTAPPCAYRTLTGLPAKPG